MSLPPRPRSASPWGSIDSIQRHADGIVFVSTPSHGGFWLSPERLAQVPPAILQLGTFCGEPSWYEEDCDAYLVVLAFPAKFTAEQVLQAVDACLAHHPALDWASYGSTPAGLHTRNILAPARPFPGSEAPDTGKTTTP